MPTIEIRTAAGKRSESWPDVLGRAESAIASARARYVPHLARTHTLDLLGLSEALAAEIALREPSITAARVHTDLKPRKEVTR